MTQPGSPTYLLLLRSIIENSSVNNREQILAAINQMSQPNPMDQQSQQLDIAHKAKTLEYIQAQIDQMKGQLMINAAEVQNKGKEQIQVQQDPLEQKLKVAEMLLKEQDQQHRHAMDTAQLHHTINKSQSDSMQMMREPAIQKTPAAPIHVNVNVDAKQGKAKKQINRDANGNIISVEDM